MTTITLQVPDEVAKQLAPLRSQLPALLLTAIEVASLDRAASASVLPSESRLLAELVELITRRPTATEIIAFKFSPQAQARLQELEDRNREVSLNRDESAELELYSQINHLMILLKARARQSYSTPN